MLLKTHVKQEEAGNGEGGGGNADLARGFVAALKKLTETNVTLEARIKAAEDAIAAGAGAVVGEGKKLVKKVGGSGKSLLDELDDAVEKFFKDL